MRLKVIDLPDGRVWFRITPKTWAPKYRMT
jgi:hypothetical protein